MLEKIEVNKEYIDSDSHKVEVWFVDSKHVFYLFTDNNTRGGFVGRDFALESWEETPTPKKRYWLWDVKSSSGEIFKSSTYMDEDGRTTLDKHNFSKESLIKKHENEWIEV